MANHIFSDRLFYFRVWIFLKNFLCAASISVKLEHFGKNKQTMIFENLQLLTF